MDDLRKEWLKIGDIMLEELKEICNNAKEKVIRLNFNDFKVFFNIGEKENGWWAACKVCGALLENESDWDLLERMTKHTLRHIDEFEKIAGCLHELGKRFS